MISDDKLLGVVQMCQAWRNFAKDWYNYKLDRETVVVEWLHGSYNSNFVYWKKGGKSICEMFPGRSIITTINFTKSMRLWWDGIEKIKCLYTNAGLVQLSLDF